MPDECDACVNPAKCGAEGRCAEYDSPLQPHTGGPTRVAYEIDGHPVTEAQFKAAIPASPPHTGEARVERYEGEGEAS